MSATGRGKEREASDFYPTDERITLDFLHRIGGLGLPPGVWWEPACGGGAIVRAVEKWRPGSQRWAASDVRGEFVSACSDIIGPGKPIVCVSVDDFTHGIGRMWDAPSVIITNPPYNVAEVFARECIKWARSRDEYPGVVALLLRVGFMGSTERIPFWREHPADIYPIAPRPSFGLNKDGKPGTDASEYAWFVWEGGRVRGRVFHPEKPWRGRNETQMSLPGGAK